MRLELKAIKKEGILFKIGQSLLLFAFLSTYKFQEQFNTLNVFLYQLIYPFYMITLLFGAFTAKLTWKGRKI
jgi:hypothetical protein